MDEILKDLKEFKLNLENNMTDEKTQVIDILYYGEISLLKEGLKKQNIYLVEKEVDGKIEHEFRTNDSVIASVGKDNVITISEQYKDMISNKEFLTQLSSVMPLSLEKLEELQHEHANIALGNSEEHIDKASAVGAGPVSARKRTTCIIK